MDAPEVGIVDVTTDEQGRTVTHRCSVAGLTMQATIDGSPPMWATEPNPDPMSRSVWVMPVRWHGGWHTNPRRQLVVALSGRWWTETQDGIRTVMGPGELHLGDDLDAVADDEDRIGHDSGTEGDEPVVLLLIRTAAGREPCIEVHDTPS